MTLDELSVGHSGVITAVGGYTLTLRKEDARSITIEEDAE